jgi:hypothetical protein
VARAAATYKRTKADNADDSLRRAGGRKERVLSNESPFEMLERALRNGTHAESKPHYCHKCRDWCDGIYFRTLDGMDLCKKHAPAPESAEAKIERAEYAKATRPDAVKRYQPNIEDVLILWASEHFPDAFRAYSARDDFDWECKVLASIVRRRAASDPGWLVRLAQSYLAPQLKMIAPHVVRAGPYPLDERQSFADWVDSVRACPV